MHASRDRSSGSDGHAAVRTCIVSRAERAPADLVRFVLDPTDTVTPDVANKLPGRGAWVTATSAAVEVASRKGLFQRAFRKPVTVPADLADTVDGLLARRAVQALSLANKAGLVVSGFSKVDAQITAGNVRALIHASDGSDGGASRLTRKYEAVCRQLARDPAVIEILTNAQLALAMGRSNVVHAAASFGRASDGFVSAARRLAHYRQPETAANVRSTDPAGRRATEQLPTEHDVGPETEEV